MAKKKEIKIKDSGYFANKRSTGSSFGVNETREERKERRAERERIRKEEAEQRIEDMLEEERQRKKQQEESKKKLWEEKGYEEAPRIQVKKGKTEFKPETLTRRKEEEKPKKSKTREKPAERPKVVIKKAGQKPVEREIEPRKSFEKATIVRKQKNIDEKRKIDIEEADESRLSDFAPRPMLKPKEEKAPQYDEETLAKESVLQEVKVKSLGKEPSRRAIKKGSISELDEGRKTVKSDDDTKEEKVYRHELKYYISEADYYMLRNSLNSLLRHDSNAGDNGDYYIRSLYFDDYKNSALVEKLSGIENRKKYRIRIYGLSDSLIRLERKNKNKDFISKDNLILTREEYDKIIKKDVGFLQKKDSQLAKDFYYEIKTKRLEPAVIVDYVREAYVHPIRNLRVTFDKVVKTGRYATSIFDEGVPLASVLPPGTVVLEIKFQKGLPDYLIGVLNTITASQRSAISKYALCRKYES